MVFCCQGFEAMARAAVRKEKGFSFLLARVRVTGDVACVLEFKAVDSPEDAKGLPWERGSSPVTISLSGRVYVRFCPCCGASIDDFYRRANLPEIEKFSDLSFPN